MKEKSTKDLQSLSMEFRNKHIISDVFILLFIFQF